MPNPFETGGMFSWFELMTGDVEGAKSFYGEVLGWEFSADSNNEDYTLVKVKGHEHPIAGIMNKTAAMAENAGSIPNHWGNYITVLDIDSALEKVERLGGTIVVPATMIPEVGKFSVIKDPQDAVIALMQYMSGC